MKNCKSCKLRKQNKEFYVSYFYKNKPIYSVECKKCSNKRTIKYRKDNKERGYSACIKHLYGVTVEDYNLMFKKQKGKCAICKTTKTQKNKRKFDIDHCHKTEKVRGLLCQNCNSGLGKFKDNTRFLKKAISYLERSNDKT